jgi:hypothetical protein
MNERLAIALYCWDIGSTLMKQKNFYFILNNMLRERNNMTMSVWEGYLYYFQTALSKFERKTISTYRGLPEKEKSMIKEEYVFTRSIHYSAYSSTSSDLSSAKGFASSNGVIICFDLFDAVSISAYSPFKNEAELLLSPNMSFIVMSELKFDHLINMDVVRLVQKKKKKVFIF